MAAKPKDAVNRDTKNEVRHFLFPINAAFAAFSLEVGHRVDRMIRRWLFHARAASRLVEIRP